MRRITCVLLTFLISALAGALAAQEFLPTPFSAEQIGEAWREGYEMTTRVWTPESETLSRTRVEGWSRETIETSEQQIDTSGAAVGETTTATSSWESLRDHARFPAESASRERVRRDTALGELDGWLYTVRGSDESVSEFFFADRYPGPPIVFHRTKDGDVLFRAETIEIKPAS